MDDRESIEKKLKDARGKVISNAAAAENNFDLEEKVEWLRKKAFLDGLGREFGGRAPDKSVFISYSRESGTIYFKIAEKRLQEAEFNVFTGFQKAQGDEDKVLSRVLLQLRRSTLYLGLLTKARELVDPASSNRAVPHVWTLEEKAMALALGKPFALLVEEGVHPDYWKATVPGKIHYVFTSENFHEKIEEVVEALSERYQEVALAHFGGDVSGLTDLQEDLGEAE